MQVRVGFVPVCDRVRPFPLNLRVRETEREKERERERERERKRERETDRQRQTERECVRDASSVHTSILSFSNACLLST